MNVLTAPPDIPFIVLHPTAAPPTLLHPRDRDGFSRYLRSDQQIEFDVVVNNLYRNQKNPRIRTAAGSSPP